MKQILSTISTQGQVTVPVEVRRQLGVGPNEKLIFIIEDEGSVRLVAPQFPTVASLVGAAGSLKKPLAWKDARRIAREDRLAAKLRNQP